MTPTVAAVYNRRVGRKPTKPVRVYMRLTQETADLIDRLVDRLGVDKTAVVEAGVRCLADREGLLSPPSLETARGNATRHLGRVQETGEPYNAEGGQSEEGH